MRRVRHWRPAASFANAGARQDMSLLGGRRALRAAGQVRSWRRALEATSSKWSAMRMRTRRSRRAWNAGVRYYDVSPWYGLGLAERRYGNFLHNKNRDDYVLSSKM